MIVRAKFVVTMDGPPVENGAVAVSGDRISAVGKFSDLRKEYAHEEMTDLGEQALLPGLINAHCHLDYTCLCRKVPFQKSFTEWIRAINAAKASLSPNDYVVSINEGFVEAKRYGTTTIVNLTAFPELVSKIKAPIRAWWFAELIDVRHPDRAKAIIDGAVEALKSQKYWGLAPHAPYTASADLYRRSAQVASLLTTHLAESRAEMSMFRDGEGELFEFLKGIGRDMSDCGAATPLEKFLDRGGSPNRPRAIEVNRPYLLVHLNDLSDNDFELLRKCGGQFSVVHCPRSHAYFRHSPFQFEKLRELGMNICLGTDSLASNEDLSLFAEMRVFQKEFPGVSAEDILRMVMVNPARALGQTNALGKIAPGFLADFIAVPAKSATSIFDEILGFKEAVNWVIQGGRA